MPISMGILELFSFSQGSPCVYLILNVNLLSLFDLTNSVLSRLSKVYMFHLYVLSYQSLKLYFKSLIGE